MYSGKQDRRLNIAHENPLLTKGKCAWKSSNTPKLFCM